ncbi:MAG: hypothetical protein JSW73_02635 [Candidatus Woesearchaeota archaeon]|nr:MAG: hypothetical protein JSW73_02635 [Candidatus Woesearchaeota archaeon]
MLASIIKHSENLPDEDILIFLNNEEIEKLEKNALKGEIFEYKDISRVYSLEMIVDEIKYGTIKVEKWSDMYRVIPCRNYYSVLKEKGWIGTRPDSHSKIDILNETVANQHEEFKNWLRNMNSKK